MTNEDESAVLKPRDPYDLAKLQLEGEFERFLEHPLTQALEAVTGAFALGSRHLGVAAGRMAQAILKGQMYENLADEWRTLREAGKLPDNLGQTKHGLYTWAELIKIIDDECPDGERLDALKAAFYAVNKISKDDAGEIVAYQLWQIGKELRSGEIMLLRTIYAEVGQGESSVRSLWAERMTRKSGLLIPELFERHEKRLAEMLLIANRGIDNAPGPNNRLTQLGLEFAKNIETYSADLASARSSRGSGGV